MLLLFVTGVVAAGEGELDRKNHVSMQDRRTSGIARSERN